MAGVMTLRLGRTPAAGGGGAPVVNEADGVVTTLQRTSTQTISSTFTAVSWSSAVTDSLGAWSSGSPTIVTVPSAKTGVEVTIHLGWSDNSDSNRNWRLSINSTVVEQHYGKAFDRSPSSASTRRLSVSPGDTLKVELSQNGFGGASLYDSAAGMTPSVEFKWFA